MSQQKIILVGGGGHCKAAIDVIESNPVYEILGILDVEEKVGETVLNYPIIGTDKEIERYASLDISFLITVGQIKSDHIRKKIFDELRQLEAKLATIISSTAYVSKHAIIGQGSIIMHHATINAGAVIGCNNIINTSANVEHDVTIQDHCHISTHTTINGGCHIGSGVFIGSNSVLSQGISVADQVIIGAGTVVNKSIPSSGTFAGVPFKRIK